MQSTPAFSTPTWIETSQQPQYSRSCLSSRRPLWRILSCSKSRLCSSKTCTVITASDPLVLTEDNVQIVLAEAKTKLGSIFGNSPENRNVGITGDVEVVSLDGPFVILRLKGRFWHKRADVLARVSTYLMERIPEICEVDIEDMRQLEDSEEESARLGV